MEFYPHLFEPLYIKGLRYRNRIWGSPTAMAMSFLSPEGFLRNEGIEHFRTRALGGAAVVTLGESAVDFEHGAGHYHSNTLCDPRALPQLTAMSDAIHQAGAVASLEISHAGKWALPQVNGGRNPFAPSAEDLPNGVHVDAMTEEDMDRVADNFAEACHFLQNAGFRMCLVHGAHTWLLGQFLSPLENRRKDKYGGSLENRARFPLMVLDRIRKRVGKDFVIEYRVNGTEGVPGGFDLPESIEFVKMLEDYVDLVHVSRGTRGVLRTRVEMHPSTFMPEAPNVYMTAAMKKAGVRTPLILVGNISSPETAERILAEGKADCIAMARALISDPEWASKARHGKSDDIRPCIKCFNCLDEKNGRIFGGGITSFTQDVVKRYACSTNPRLGIEHVPVPPATEKKLVCVIGGGPAGMQAAITAAERGHRVMLFEKSAQLGGQLVFSDYVSFKKPLRDFKNYLIHRVGKLGVQVFLNTEASPELVRGHRPDALIAAVGATPFIPPIPGTDLPCVLSAARACMHPEDTGRRVIVIGGGDTGCETALHLAEHGREVLILEMDDVLARRTGYTHRIALMDKVEREVESMTSTTCTAIHPDGVDVNGPQGGQFLTADTVVLCIGSRARRDLADSFRSVAPEFRIAGDADTAKNVRQAIRQGYDAACRL